MKFTPPRKDSLTVTKKFVDRIVPRQSFWNELEHLRKATAAGEQEIRVINYWGADGMGKSALLAQLRRELAAREPELKFVSYDLANGALTDTVLSRMTRLLHRDYELEFPLFDYANYVWQCNKGEEASKPEVKGLIERSPFLRTAASLLGAALPTLGFMNQLFTNQRVVELLTEGAEKAAQALNISDHLFTLFASLWKDKKYQSEFNLIETADTVDLAEALPHYFAYDLCRELEPKNEPIVFFIDTYEELLKNVDNVHHALRWLYGVDGLAREISNALWVVASRKALDWATIDKYWNGINAESLQPLEPADREELLADLPDASLRAQLCERSGGEPWLLDHIAALCTSLAAQNKTPELADFDFPLIKNNPSPVTQETHSNISSEAISDRTETENTDDLSVAVERYVGLLGEQDSDLIVQVLQLSCLERWSWDLFSAVIGDDDSVTQETINRISELSFVEHDDSSIGIIAPVRMELVSVCPDLFRLTTLYHVEEWCRENIKLGKERQSHYEEAMINYIALTFTPEKTADELLNNYSWEVKRSLELAQKRGLFEIVDRCYTKLDTATQQWPNSNCRAVILLDTACFLHDTHDYDRGAKCARNAYNIFLSNKESNNEELLFSMLFLSMCLYKKGDYTEAKSLLDQLLRKAHDSGSVDEYDKLDLMIVIADLLCDMEDYTGAKVIQEQVLAKLREDEDSNIDHDVLTAMSDLANTLHNLGENKQAKSMQEEVLKRYHDRDGDTAPNTLAAMNNLALILGSMGNYKRAKALQEQVLQIYRAGLGNYHPNTITAMNNLAVTLNDMGQYDDAKALKEDVLQISREAFGNESSDTIDAMTSLAITINNMGDYNAAKALGEQALQESRKSLGEAAPNTINAMECLAKTLGSLGDYTAQKDLLELALEKSQITFGPNSTKTLSMTKELAKAFHDMWQHMKAKNDWAQLLEECLDIYGDNDHYEVIKAMVGLAAAHYYLGEYPEAENLQRQVLEKYRKHFGDDDPRTLGAMDDLERTLRHTGKDDDANELLQETLRNRLKGIAQENSDGNITKTQALKEYLEESNQSLARDELKNHIGSKEYLSKLLEIYRNHFGDYHPNTLITQYRLASELNDLGENEQAKKFLKESLPKFRWIFGDSHPDTQAVYKKLKPLQSFFERLFCK